MSGVVESSVIQDVKLQQAMQATVGSQAYGKVLQKWLYNKGIGINLEEAQPQMQEGQAPEVPQIQNGASGEILPRL